MEEDPKRKRLLMIAGGITLLIVLVIVIVSLLPSNSQESSGKTDNSASNVTPGSGARKSSDNAPQVSPKLSPEVNAKAFYDWYVNDSSPIKSGAYKERADITDDLKQTMGIFVSRGIEPGYDHVFCEISKLPKDVTLSAPEYSDNNMLALITFKNNAGSDLFQMKMENKGGAWLVADVWCPSSQ